MSLFSIPIDKVLSTVGGIADELTTSQEEILQAELESRRLDLEEQRINQAGDMAQIEVNKEEAKSNSLFVSGWRPAVGWVCVAGLAWNYIAHPLFMWGWVSFGGSVDDIPPELDLSDLMTLLLGLLGMASIRSFDKVKGVQTESIG